METENRGRGRPRKPVDPNAEPKETRGRGRPKGSKNKPKPPKRGKPKGTKNGYTMSEAAIIQRKESSIIQPIRYPIRNKEEAEENARMIDHIIKINEIATQANRDDLLSLKSCFVAYLRLCQENGFRVGNLSAYAAMGMSYREFHSFSRRQDPEIRKFCQFVRETCAMFRETMVSENKLNPVIGIFWQRNYDGLRNDTEQIQAVNDQEDDLMSTKGYKDKYKKMIGEET